jgi:hypothetical protein
MWPRPFALESEAAQRSRLDGVGVGFQRERRSEHCEDRIADEIDQGPWWLSAVIGDRQQPVLMKELASAASH